jgi:hypothetical protein
MGAYPATDGCKRVRASCNGISHFEIAIINGLNISAGFRVYRASPIAVKILSEIISIDRANCKSLHSGPFLSFEKFYN